MRVYILVIVLYFLGQSEARRHALVKRQSATQPCMSGTCLNGGVCFPFNNLGVCVCPPGYGGLFCQIMTHPGLTNPSAVTVTAVPSLSNLCVPNPCLNGGLCLPVSTNLATCACPKNFSGMHCQLFNGLPFVASTTTAAPAVASSTSNTNNNIATVSISPFAVCFPGACLNGGTCLTIANLGVCLCLPNFSGSRCEFPQNGVTLPPNFFLGNSTATGATNTTAAVISSVAPCLTSNPCLNGGLCLVLNGSPTCFCNAGTFPPLCSTTPSASTSAPSTTSAGIGNCNPNPCLNNQPCLFIQNQPVCFCGAGFLPPLCSSSGATTPAATTVSVGACPPPDQCNSNPCLVVNGNVQCFCTNGSTASNCATTG